MTPEDIRLTRYVSVRSRSERLCAPLSAEDHVPQPVSDVSPPKWHLAHTTWFFETFVLAKQQPDIQMLALPQTEQVVDIHCVTTWSKFDTRWRGVTLDTLLQAAGLEAPTPWVLAHSQDGYSTNVPLADLTQGRAMIATHYDDRPLAPEHGGPARLLVPHLYFWKSAKWVNALQFNERDEAGFWELRGYHMRGDPFKEERYG